MGIVYFENKFVEEEEAKISIKTNSFHYGTAVFEGIRAYYNKENDTMYGLFFKEHYQRLFKNMRILNMEIEESIDELVEITKELVKRNNHKEDVYIRPIVYFSDLAIGPKLIGYTAKIAIYTLPLGDYIDTDKGIKAKVSSWVRLNDNMIPPRLKVTGAYVNSALAKTEALLAGAEEAIVLNKNGFVSEGSAENIFIVRDGKLITPPVSDDILEGITRKAVIDIASDLGISVIERSLARTELYVADEVFFCGTGAQISPVIEIDGRKIGSGTVGEITKKIKDIYFDAVRGKVEKYKNWIVEIK
ncbi:branched-chain amino acid transaminase [Sulfurihydrogenibium subterraneum]|uniref:branched-chain amino acid transaminase n=1 Tax=Sulfurihydrogenibium subterraneum TaxID=171121 RepID=UPI000490603A|nr:branched-chain amino acid transaminase [Sulfurihydrogenibium subterraneum]